MAQLLRPGRDKLVINMGETVVIGRNKKLPEDHQVEADGRVSSQHCAFTSSPDALTITDRSTNGTFVNGDLVGKGKLKALRPGDVVTFCFAKEEVAVSNKFPTFTVLEVFTEDDGCDAASAPRAPDESCSTGPDKAGPPLEPTLAVTQEVDDPSPPSKPLVHASSLPVVPAAKRAQTAPARLHCPSKPPAATPAAPLTPSLALDDATQVDAPDQDSPNGAADADAHDAAAPPPDDVSDDVLADAAPAAAPMEDVVEGADAAAGDDGASEATPVAPSAATNASEAASDRAPSTPTRKGSKKTEASPSPASQSPASAAEDKVPVWYYKDDLEISEDDEEGWAPYPEAISKKIEKGFKALKEVLAINKKYSVHYADKRQFQTKDKDRQRPIKRMLHKAPDVPWLGDVEIPEVPDMETPKAKRKPLKIAADSDSDGSPPKKKRPAAKRVAAARLKAAED